MSDDFFACTDTTFNTNTTQISADWLRELQALIGKHEITLRAKFDHFAFPPLCYEVFREGHYRNPFDFMTETEQWFEFNWRTRFHHEKSLDVIKSMLTDVKRIHAAYDDGFKWTVRHHYGVVSLDSRSVLIATTS